MPPKTPKAPAELCTFCSQSTALRLHVITTTGKTTPRTASMQLKKFLTSEHSVILSMELLCAPGWSEHPLKRHCTWAEAKLVLGLGALLRRAGPLGHQCCSCAQQHTWELFKPSHVWTCHENTARAVKEAMSGLLMRLTVSRARTMKGIWTQHFTRGSQYPVTVTSKGNFFCQK